MSIVTDGLVYYYNSKQGSSSTLWQNLISSSYHITMTDAIVESDGVYFNGSATSRGVSPTSPLVPFQTSHTLEIGLRVQDNTKSVYFFNGYRSGADYRALSINSNEVLRLHDGAGTIVSTYTVPINTNVIITLKRMSATSQALYVNGVFHSNLTTVQDVSGFTGRVLLGTNDGGGDFKGHISFVRQYNRALSDAEITQNYAVGYGVGFVAYPSVTIVGHTLTKISQQASLDRSVVTFNFDKDVVEYRANVLGVSWDTGTLAHAYTGNVTAGTNVTAEIDWSELSAEGENRINIYGKTASGEWTPYDGVAPQGSSIPLTFAE